MQPSAEPTTSHLLAHLRALPGEPASWWNTFDAAHWPTLFRLLDLAAGLPPLHDNPALANLSPELWPDFTAVTGDLLRLQQLVAHPIVPNAAQLTLSHSADALTDATAELERDHCTTLADLLDPASQALLETAIAELEREHTGRWGQLAPVEAPALFELAEEILSGEPFRQLTGFELGHDDYSLTLSLQSLEPVGIAWHRDLYWPREWVGQDVFAVFYALGNDSPEKGGAFVYYLPWSNQIRAIYRRRHQATVLWNGRTHEQRILHAVSGYAGASTDRHLLILQCLRRSR